MNLSKQEKIAIEKFLSKLKVIYIDEEITQKLIAIKKESNLKLPDAIICATIFNENAVLVTADKQLINKSEQLGIKTKFALQEKL